MSKSHRGTGIRTTPNHGRGECPRCKNKNIKVLYETDLDGKKVKICKYCQAALKNQAKKAAKVTAPATEAAAE